MATIEIDFEVYKNITIRRHNETVTPNDVLRELLGLPPSNAAPAADRGNWTWKGVILPNGTELRAEYKGQAFTAKIEDGKWMQDGQPRTSPSAAAHAITQSGVNGWWFWSAKRPTDAAWMPLHDLRP